MAAIYPPLGMSRAPACITLASLAICSTCGLQPVAVEPPADPPAEIAEGSAASDGIDASGPQGPNVVLILIDTWRADRVRSYGGPRDTAPFFDEVAATGFRFHNAYAPCSWTRPSVASLFTGTYPQRHGVQMRQDVLPAGIPTLAGALSEAGWNTYLINTNPHVTETWGMTRGFRQTLHLMPHPDQFKAGNGANVVLRHLRRTIPSIEPPYFLYVHVIDPHYPFDPPPRDLAALGIDAEKAGKLGHYDGEIRFADRHVRSMIEALTNAGLMDDTVLVVTSDHGDEFYDHGSTGHGKTLYQEVIRVPLAIRLPEGRLRELAAEGPLLPPGSTIDENVSLVDVAPTLLDLVGAPALRKSDGTSLVPRLRGEAPAESRPLYFSVAKEGKSLAAILAGPSKLTINRTTRKRQLVFLDEDPTERRAWPTRRPGLERLARRLGDALTTFEWSVQPGLHVQLAGLDGQKDRRRMTLRLTTDGAFTTVETRGFEGRDRFVLSRDRRTLRIRAHLTSFWHRSPKHVWVQDRDELRVGLEPLDAAVTVSVLLDDKPAPTGVLRFPQPGPTDRGWPVTLSHAQLVDTAALVDRQQAGAYVYLQTPVEKREILTVSREITEALRVLGYIQ